MLRVCVTNLSLSCLVWCPRVVPHVWHVVLPNFVNFGFVPMPKCWQGGPFCPSSSFWNQSLVKTYATTLVRTSCASATFEHKPNMPKISYIQDDHSISLASDETIIYPFVYYIEPPTEQIVVVWEKHQWIPPHNSCQFASLHGWYLLSWHRCLNHI